MENIKSYFSIIYIVFILGYWLSFGILLYHLKRYGIGRHVKSFFYISLMISILLTVITTLFYIKI